METKQSPLTEAAKQALEALETCVEDEWYTDDDYGMVQTYDEEKVYAAITALRTAIEQAEKQEPVAWMDASETALSWENYLDDMKPLYTTPPAAQPAPVQEPRCAVIVEVFGKDWRLDYMSLPVGKHKLYTQQYIYTTPPAAQPCPTCEALARTVMMDQTAHDTQRQPLTDEEIKAVIRAGEYDSMEEFARAIERKHGIGGKHD